MTQDELNLPDANEDTLLAVNAWLSRHQIQKPYHDNVKQAGRLIAKAYMAGELYQARTEGVVVSKSSKAGDVSVSKTYASGQDGQAMGQYEMMALDLIKPFIITFGGMASLPVIRG
ncbi:hypothetical protein LP123_05195 [Moraxella bovis]|uniref:DUF4054 domain-containing protein n=1 Tax=Moraxella bovis TaxID=476 RepID=A0ABY6MBW1_MORBO|nr:hypothetical protein [Moraxella bovis]UYZ74915.1 hypothetical protein LP093_09055 [Moraxella bovis]UYZ79157.1 hypothetical protein LP115_04810 [Moraxella bovis]UYZ80261.1 hypothetical protein LP113_09420 [Moraxella bovis]UYZ87637.1 hypothetical protein LP094_04815 [Moraxella bovis]UYZ94459.1 hypothetical protein LP121_11345 [Moraxella bovis]